MNRSTNHGDDIVSIDGHRYKRVRFLGQGAFGKVYECKRLDTGDYVAVKEIELDSGKSTAAAVRRECDLLSRVKHKNIVSLLGYDVHDQKALLVMELVKGGSLRDKLQEYVKESTGMPEKLVRSYTRQILAGLECLHENGIVHRDVKPDNILVKSDFEVMFSGFFFDLLPTGCLVITDFGLSKLLPEDASVAQTCGGGSPCYMAPEVLNGEYSVASDIWSVGATVSEVLTGRLLWSHVKARSVFELLVYISKHPEDHPEIPPNLNAEGKDFLERCFRRNPIARGTAGSLLQLPFLRMEPGDEIVERTCNLI